MIFMATRQRTMNMKQILAVGMGVPEDKAIKEVSPRREQPCFPKPRPATSESDGDATDSILIW